MNEIPLSWVTCPFGDLNEFYGANIDPASHPTERFELYSIPIFPTRKPEQPLGSEVGSTKQIVEHNDVLISKINPRINRVWQVGSPMGLRQIASSEWIGFRSPQMDARFFCYYFTSPFFRELLCSDVTGVGGSLTRAQPKRVAGFPVPVAPVNEQKRIADKLDTILTRVTAVNTRLARVITILKRFRQSVLAAATSGRLTEDWRGGSQATWPTLRAEQVCATVQSGGTPKGGFQEGGIPFLKVYNIVDQKVAFDYKPQYVSAAVLNTTLRKSQAQPGDVLMNIVGPPLGKVAIVPAEHSAWNINQAITLFRPSERISSQWIYFVLCEGAPIREVLNRTKGSVGQINISLSQCRAFELPVPPADEQAEIVRRVDTLFAFADRLEARLKAAQSAAERLTPALLAKAFRGELVPQDPSDEPASELLRKLQREVPSSNRKRGRKAAT